MPDRKLETIDARLNLMAKLRLSRAATIQVVSQSKQDAPVEEVQGRLRDCEKYFPKDPWPRKYQESTVIGIEADGA